MTAPRPRPMQICIIRPPTGEAPQWVRAAWVGILFPRALRASRPVRGQGVLTGSRTVFGFILAFLLGRTTRMTGYLVAADAAVAALDTHAPDAAQWWRENAPHAIAPGRLFLFNTDACQEI